MEIKLTALIDNFVNAEGCFNKKVEKVELGRRQVRNWKKNGIIPIEFLQHLSENSYPNVIKAFRNVSRYNRTVSMLAEYIRNQKRTQNNSFAFLNAVGRQMGNLRYQISDTRAWPETIMNNLVKIGVDSPIEYSHGATRLT